MTMLQAKIALVTGASRGIGRAIAEAFGREGAMVIVNYASNAAAAEETVAGIRAAGGQAIALQADTTKPQALRGLFAEGERVGGGLDIVVLNAHPGLGHGTITALDEAVIDQQLAVLKSYVVGLQEAGRRVRDGGVILCISSSASHVANPDVALYGAVKLAVEQLARGLSRELSARKVRVLALAPGLTRTDRLSGAAIDLSVVPSCDPQDIAECALFLASDAARWVNTQTLFVNGGAVYAQ